ncbi:MAG: Eco57I restriction-modification methylase domain-containing protein [Dolichospermum sp.]
MRKKPKKFNAIIANPPYIRHHRIDEKMKQFLRELFISITGFTIDGRALSYDIDKIAMNELSVQLKEPSGSYVVQIIKSGKSFYFPIIVY